VSPGRQIFAKRRAAALAEMRRQGGGVMLIPAGEEKIRSNDSEFIFRQDNDFYYLTGFDEPQGCALLIADPPSNGPQFVMFVRPKDKEREIWTGRRAGVEGAQRDYGAEVAHPLSELEERLPKYLAQGWPLWFRLGRDPVNLEWDQRVIRILAGQRNRGYAGVVANQQVNDVEQIIHDLRLHKDDEELSILRKAAAITDEGHRAAMRLGRAGTREYQLQAEIEHVFRRQGGMGPGYGTIVAAGPNSCILHYRAGDAELRAGEVCLVDAGGEYDHYTADVTRTFPVSGRFTPAQRDLYQVCLDAQLQAIAQVKPGSDIEKVHTTATRRLVEGMIALGLLQGKADDRIADQSFRRYYMHRTSHWLGMDVHDVGAYQVGGKPRPFAPGMVLTVEPGFYVAEDDDKAPKEMRGVGIRIEDDVLVTAAGNEVLTRAVPKTVAEVEAACG
jgi:Xaa-Pro aminopeptidase